MNTKDFNILSMEIITQVNEAREAGQQEYAHDQDNIFANFDRVGSLLSIGSEKTLMVYLLKHIDGITAYLDGLKSQREDVRGRIKDAIVYLMLLWAMVEEKNND